MYCVYVLCLHVWACVSVMFAHVFYTKVCQCKWVEYHLPMIQVQISACCCVFIFNPPSILLFASIGVLLISRLIVANIPSSIIWQLASYHPDHHTIFEMYEMRHWIWLSSLLEIIKVEWINTFFYYNTAFFESYLHIFYRLFRYVVWISQLVH